MVVSILVVYPFVPDCELPSITRVCVLPVTLMGQDQNSEFHVLFLLNACMAFAIRYKNLKLNNSKLENICIHFSRSHMDLRLSCYGLTLVIQPRNA